MGMSTQEMCSVSPMAWAGAGPVTPDEALGHPRPLCLPSENEVVIPTPQRSAEGP